MFGREGRRWRVLVVLATVGLLLLLWDQRAASAGAGYARGHSHAPFAAVEGHGAPIVVGVVPYRDKAASSHPPRTTGPGGIDVPAAFVLTLLFLGVAAGACRRPPAALRAPRRAARAPPVPSQA